MGLSKFIGAAAVAVIALSAAAASAAEPTKLRQGWVVAPADSPLFLFGKKGITKHEGTSYTLDAPRFNGTPPMITALAGGEIDLVPFAYSTFALAIENAKMNDLRVIADIFQDGVEGYHTNKYYVLKDSPIKTVEDLKGKVLAANANGSALDIAMRAMLRKNGLEDKKDVTIIEVGFPNMKAVLNDKKVDVISAVLPFSEDKELLAASRTLFTQKDAIGRSQMLILTAKADFIQKNRAALIDYLEDYLRLLRWYEDQANHDEVVKLVSDYSKIPAPVFDSWMFIKGKDYYRDPAGMPELTALQSNLDLAQQLGFVKGKIDVSKYVDLSLVQEAAKRVK